MRRGKYTQTQSHREREREREGERERERGREGERERGREGERERGRECICMYVAFLIGAATVVEKLTGGSSSLILSKKPR
jgi:hypothetical protein